MKKFLIFLALLLFLMPVMAFAAASTPALFDSITLFSTDDLLQLRELIDDELEQRNVAVAKAPVYILNVNTRKFHFPSCKSVLDMKEKNKIDFFGVREELIAKEYAPCQKCHP